MGRAIIRKAQLSFGARKLGYCRLAVLFLLKFMVTVVGMNAESGRGADGFPGF